MKGFHLLSFCAVLFFHGFEGRSQKMNSELLTSKWKAVWISINGESGKDYGVYQFRKSIELGEIPSSFVIHVSADNRYKLFVNNNLVSLGPARGDVYHWNFETVDLAVYLKPGKNTVAALVWNEGEYRPEAQISHRTGFILQGNSTTEEVLNTNDSWKVFKSTAYKPLSGVGYPTYFVAGPGEIVDMNAIEGSWVDSQFDDSSWAKASPIGWGAQGAPKGMVDAFGWMLVPSALPQMEMFTQRFHSVRKSQGVKFSDRFLKEQVAFSIPANTTVTLLLDQSFLTNAYMNMRFRGGKNSTITLTYAEALFEASNPIKKGNRNEIEGKKILGRKDSIISNGNADQFFTTLSWRTYRYVQMRVSAKETPLTIEDIYGTFVGFPFKRLAGFGLADNPTKQILDIGWRTARLCAVETYMDCPYYEQLQYIGDTRIQALISYYNSGDDRLARNALNQMDHSRLAEGVTLSRHPSYSPQIIPTFSLWYIGMLHDYWMYRPDELFVKEKLHGVREILEFFSRYQIEDGSLKNAPYWLFCDWVNDKKTWNYGMAPKGADGASSVLDLQLLWAYKLASTLESKLGMKEYADTYSLKAKKLAATIRAKYWDEAKQVFADTHEKDLYSQHANTLAILTGLVEGDAAKSLAEKILTMKEMAPASIYFKFYTHQALTKAGLGDDYLMWLDKWRENIDMGLTTWAEISDVSGARSDCHAWGSSPNIEIFRTVLGIDSDAPGFKRIKIEPHLGKLSHTSGEIPHPNGKINVSYKLEKKRWNVFVSLPTNTSGYLIWKGEKIDLKTGDNQLTFNEQ
jgi:alpha-L-rhamnosidase